MTGATPSPPPAATARLLARPWRDIAVFRGRATRTELAATLVLTQTLAALVHLFASRPGLEWLADALHAILLLPLFALAARRLHDIGAPGWPGPLAVGTIAMMDCANGTLFGRPAEIALAVPAAVLLVALVFRPPAPGANAYGTDPRRERPVAA